jgi:hypothetical protein
MSAKDRPFTMFAARTALGQTAVNRLKQGACPMCGSTDKTFKNKVSTREHGITGLCQTCQDKVFAPPPDDDQG